MFSPRLNNNDKLVDLINKVLNYLISEIQFKLFSQRSSHRTPKIKLKLEFQWRKVPRKKERVNFDL